MSAMDLAILGTGMTDLSRRDLSLEEMTYQAVTDALADAGIGPDDLALVIMGNALAGRLSDQGCVRGQTYLRKTGLNDVAIINVDNSCAGGSSALHLATGIAMTQDRPVLALGVEKMWTGDRGETIAGIEDGLPSDYRHELHARLPAFEDNPAGSIPQWSLNNGWAQQVIATSAASRRARSPPWRSRPSTMPPATRWPNGSAR